MAIQLSETDKPATVIKYGSQEYNLAGNDKVQVRSKVSGGEWVEDLLYDAPNGKVSRVVIALHIEEV